MKKNNLIKLIKQSTAGLLTAVMVLTGAPFGNADGHNSTDGYGARGGEDTFTFGLGGLKS